MAIADLFYRGEPYTKLEEIRGDSRILMCNVTDAGRKKMEALRAEYESRTGERVEFSFGKPSAMPFPGAEHGCYRPKSGPDSDLTKFWDYVETRTGRRAIS